MFDLLKKLPPCSEDQLKHATLVDRIEAYVPLALKIARKYSFKFGKTHEEVAEISLYHLTKALNAKPTAGSTYLRKAISGATLRDLFEDKTIRIPTSNNGSDLKTEPITDATSKIHEEIDGLKTRLLELELEGENKKLFDLQMLGYKDKELCKAFNVSRPTLLTKKNNLKRYVREQG